MDDMHGNISDIRNPNNPIPPFFSSLLACSRSALWRFGGRLVGRFRASCSQMGRAGHKLPNSFSKHSRPYRGRGRISRFRRGRHLLHDVSHSTEGYGCCFWGGLLWLFLNLNFVLAPKHMLPVASVEACLIRVLSRVINSWS